jgi:hypothetical protein
MYEHMECHLCPHLGGAPRHSAGIPIVDCVFNGIALITRPSDQSSHILVEGPPEVSNELQEQTGRVPVSTIAPNYLN